MSENKLLRRIFGLERGEVSGGWRKLREELHNLYSSPNVIGMVRWAVHVERMGTMRNACRI
jgi:hypothetical protein